ncbi:MAG: beta-N-acetylglucosaminidase domain-containing protein [Verrucomicrobiae bacterium]|nr:beta-N-acetylglucosaminidase domain-containing protein [Verrucomicrobiae bacterium]
MGTTFLSGVIEGFYGPPWHREERRELFGWMAAWGLNTYVYGPKDDLHHRVLWREPYSAADGSALKDLVAECHQHGLEFYYALGPGLDLRYSDPADREALRGRLAQLRDFGCRNFCLLFDDIPDRMSPEDRERWGSFASAQCAVVNDLFRWIRGLESDARFLFCPTPYCGRMAWRQLGGPDYLATVGRELDPEIGVFWTGPEIISGEITLPHIAELTALLRRPPVIWDNLQANDYDGHRFFAGPFSGRPPELRSRVGGVLLNPNTEFPLNFIPIRTLAMWVRLGGDGEWRPREAYREALAEWHPKFEGALRTISLEDLTLLMDCYYLPYEEGLEAMRLQEALRGLLARPPAAWGEEAARVEAMLARLREACARMAELRNRPLFHALSRRVWELREELDLLGRFVRHHADPAQRDAPFQSDFHQLLTYRGGMVASLQRLLQPQPDGTFTATPGLIYVCEETPNS